MEVKLERGSMLQRMGMKFVSVLSPRTFSIELHPFQKGMVLQAWYARNQAIEICTLVLQGSGDAKSSGCI